MKFRLFASVAATGLVGALGLPHAATAQVAQDQQAQAAPAPAAPAPAPAAPAAPTSNAMATPAMGPTIAANPNPYSVDLGPLGKTYVTGAVTGIGFGQSNALPAEASPGNRSWEADLTNGMAAIQKTDGAFQYFVQAGVYSFPSLGTPYLDASHTNSSTYGPVPVAYLKYAPTDTLSFEVGKLPTLIGEEYSFTYENLNIERGLLWEQENVFNRGIQGNYTVGPVALALSLNDGFYSNVYTYLTGSATWTVDSANTIVFAGGGNLSKDTNASTLASPQPYTNEQQYDLSWTWANGPWSVNPYIQYTHVPSLSTSGGLVTSSGSTYGGALLVDYTFDSSATLGGMSLGGWSLPGRVEYLSTTGNTATGPALLAYGPGSKAWSLTVTPTYQYKIFFGRAELSFVKASSIVPGLGFGTSGGNDTQFRGLVEAGFVF